MAHFGSRGKQRGQRRERRSAQRGREPRGVRVARGSHAVPHRSRRGEEEEAVRSFSVEEAEVLVAALSTRAVGNTTAMRKGADASDCFVVFPTYAQAEGMGPRGKSISLAEAKLRLGRAVDRLNAAIAFFYGNFVKSGFS